MNTTRKVLASLVTLLAACLMHAADMKPVARVMTIIDVETDDPSGYATWIAQYNAIAKAKIGVDGYLRVYQSYFDGRGVGRVRVATSGANVAEMAKNAMTLENEPAILELNTHLRQVRKMGARVLYQAIRFEGALPKGQATYTTLANVTDEAGYLQALDQLRSIMDAAGLKDIKIGAYRVLAGRTDHTHRITMGCPNMERLAAFLDQAGTNPQVQAWVAASAKYRTVVSNYTSREISK